MADVREELDAYYSSYMNEGQYYNVSFTDDLEKRLGPKRQDLSKVVPITVAYCIIFFAGIGGNIATCAVIMRNRYMHTATNYYLFNLAIADLLVLVLGLPIELYSFWSAYPWVFGEAFCVLRNMAAEMSTNAAILTITAFTIERYVAICHPMRAQRMSSLSRAARVIVVVWVVAAICSFPQALQFGLIYVNDRSGKPIEESVTCNLIPGHRIKHTFELATFLFFFAPMAIITGMYALMAMAIRRSAVSRCGSSSSEGGDSQGPQGTTVWNRRPRRARRAVVKMLVAVVVAFFVCWAPFHAQRLMVLYVQRWTKQLLDIQMTLFYISGVLYYISSTINPILYNIMSLKFRKAFRDTLLWRSCPKRRRPQLNYSYKFSRRILHSDTKSDVYEQGSPLPVRELSGSFPALKNSVIVSRDAQRSIVASIRVLDESVPNGHLFSYVQSKSQQKTLSSDRDNQFALRFAYRGT